MKHFINILTIAIFAIMAMHQYLIYSDPEVTFVSDLSQEK